jgi:hypothetical protein
MIYRFNATKKIKAMIENLDKPREKEISTHSQNMMIKKFLEAGGRLTQREAIERPFHCYRLSARIWDLRHKERYGNMKIRTDMVGHGEKLFASYSLIREEA